MTVSELYIYPIKSLGGISIQEAEITDRGFRYDRRWMLVNEANSFLTQREFPEMALLQVGFEPDGLKVTHKHLNISPLQISFSPETDEKLTVAIFDDICLAKTVSIEADDWFSEILQNKCRLVFMPDESKRLVEEKYAKNQEITSLSDGYPFLIIGQSSLDDLNDRLTEKLPMNRFRPNIVFTGGEPFAEDTWQQFDIQGVSFFPVKPCARCQITTTNQETAEVAKEPLKTLATFRRNGHKVLFGMNLLHNGTGTIRVGEELIIKM